MQDLSLGGDSDSDLSAYIHPSKKARKVPVTVVDEESEDELATIKKKMYVFFVFHHYIGINGLPNCRPFGKKPAAVVDVEETPMGTKSSQSAKRRQTRGTR
jgi:hypothetical protein